LSERNLLTGCYRACGHLKTLSSHCWGKNVTICIAAWWNH